MCLRIWEVRCEPLWLSARKNEKRTRRGSLFCLRFLRENSYPTARTPASVLALATTLRPVDVPVVNGRTAPLASVTLRV